MHHQIKIVLTAHGVRMLENVIIIDPTQVDLLSWVVFSYGVTTIVAT